MSFGTGHHETTRSCLDLLLKTKDSSFLTKPINSILDIGSGSGILSIFSSLIFQCKVNGIDIDLEAINQSLSNLRLNSKVSNVDFKLKNKYIVFKPIFIKIKYTLQIEEYMFKLISFIDLSNRENNIIYRTISDENIYF